MTPSERNLLEPILASDARVRPTLYPAFFAKRMLGRTKRPLGDSFGLSSFGVNFTTLEPGAQSALKHRHTVQDEFIYVLSGCLTVVFDQREFSLVPGMCFGFPRGGGSHHILNRTAETATYLEVGDRQAGDEVYYPDDDLQVRSGPGGQRRFEHKNGEPY